MMERSKHKTKHKRIAYACITSVYTLISCASVYACIVHSSNSLTFTHSADQSAMNFFHMRGSMYVYKMPVPPINGQLPWIGCNHCEEKQGVWS